MKRLTALRKGRLFDARYTDPSDFGLGLDSPLFSWSNNVERVGPDYVDYVEDAYRTNGPVFSCVLARMLLFTEASFVFRRRESGTSGKLFGTKDLEILERPWPNGSTGELLAKMEQDVSLAGNSYWTVVSGKGGPRLRRLRPDWVTIVTGSESGDPYALDAGPVAYMYSPPGADPSILLPENVAHYSPIPDPAAQWRGMSWITPILDELSGDKAANKHKAKYFSNGAHAGLAISYAPDIDVEQLKQFRAIFDVQRRGVDNAYKTLHLGGGADAKVLSSDFKQLDFKAVQGAGETRIAAAAGVPPIVAGFSEGLASSTYSNYGQARRKFADHWARPHWRMVSAALERIVNVPAGAQLWYDDKDISFLQEDARESAEIEKIRANTLRALVDGGFTWESAIRAVETGDLSQLDHTGLFSVQLRPAGEE